MDDAGASSPNSSGVARLGDFRTDGGAVLPGVELAYRTWGRLNAAGDNAVLVCHALTGDQHVADREPSGGRPGWWARVVGPGRPIDTRRWFVVCANVLGGCAGSTGPGSCDPATGAPYGLGFPVISIADMVRAQIALLEALGVGRLAAVVGGSMGGMQALQWAAAHPERVGACVALATAARHSAQNIAFHEVGRQAVMADPDWRGGDYLQAGVRPEKGLAVARMAAHVTYLSELALGRKFGRERRERARPGAAPGPAAAWGFDADFQVQSYLRHQGAAFVDRFDANSYLYITRAMDDFDLAAAHDGVLARAFERARAVRFFLASFTSDWLYPTAESRAVVRALNAAGARASFVEIASDKGHDAFLLDEPVLAEALAGFMRALA